MIGLRKATALRIAIVGQYKSGTTMLIYSIEDSLPSKSRLLFKDQQYTFRRRDRYLPVLAKVVLGAPENGHAVDYESFLTFDKIISAIRDPRDWLTSVTLFLISQHVKQHADHQTITTIIDLLKQEKADSSSVALVTILEKTLECLPGKSLTQVLAEKNRQIDWLFAIEERLGHHVRVKYENFIDEKNFRLTEYLGLSVNCCPTVSPAHSHVPRTISFGNWRDWFLPKDNKLFRPIFDPYLRRYQYETSWEVNPTQRVQPEHSSQYVERTMRRCVLDCVAGQSEFRKDVSLKLERLPTTCHSSAK